MNSNGSKDKNKPEVANIDQLNQVAGGASSNEQLTENATVKVGSESSKNVASLLFGENGAIAIKNA